MTFADPATNIKELSLRDGQIVADLGAGSGFYSREASRSVGSTGKVYALEVQKDLTTRLASQAKSEGLTNIECIWADIEIPNGTKLGSRIIDAAIVSNVLFQIDDKVGFSREVARIMKPGGQVMVIDWSESYGGMGPKSDTLYSKQKAIELFDHAGFTVSKEFSAGAHHYGIIFKKT
jgi:ubiquinone/menaquinone biosynthesis C-methylase UbiE